MQRIFGVIVFSALFAISIAYAEGGLPTGTSIDDHIGSVTRSAVWKTTDIPVCWENPSTGAKKYQDITRKAVEETWSKHSKLKFSGWEKCRPNALGIRIQISDSGPHVKGLGRFLDGRPNGMVLNFSFDNWSPSCQKNIDYCVYVIAVHEFGHAIGLAHEQNRADAPKECRDDYHKGSTGDFNITQYDPMSVMNYCNPNWSNDGILSEMDIASAIYLYGED